MFIHRKPFKVQILLVLILSFLLPCNSVSAKQNQSFQASVSKDVEKYIKKTGGDIAIEYRDLKTKETYKRKSTKGYIAASTIKLPLAMYVMELADKKKLNLNQKLTYKSYHYVGGSGVIQYQKVGTKYTIKDLVKKAMIYSDNIAFNMLRERVGKENYVSYMKKLGASYSTPNALQNTSSHDLSNFAQHLYAYSQKSKNGKTIVKYLQNTVYNNAIPKGIKGTKVSHKVGMIPMYYVSHDYGIVYDQDPYILVVMTKGFSYEKSNKVIAGISSIINKHHKKKLKYIKTKSEILVYKIQSKKQIVGTLNEKEVFRVIPLLNTKWLEIQVGKTNGYVQNIDVTRYTKSPVKLYYKNINMNRTVKMINETPVFNKPSSQSSSFANIKKGVRIPVSKINQDYYAIILGSRIGYIQASDTEAGK